jgi:hypothetical protein
MVSSRATKTIGARTMTTYLLGTLARYVLVDANDEAEARAWDNPRCMNSTPTSGNASGAKCRSTS